MRRRVRDHDAETYDGVVKPKAPSALRVLRGKPLYRGVTVAEFRSALGVPAAAPQIASFLVKELDASLFVVMLAPANGRDVADGGRSLATHSVPLPRHMTLLRPRTRSLDGPVAAATAVRPEARTGYVLPLSSGRGEPRRFSSQFP